MARYSEEFKTAIINKILSPETTSIRSVAKESALPIGTVLNWLSAKGIDMEIINQKLISTSSRNSSTVSSSTVSFSQENKLKIIIETYPMSDEELSAYCRKKGIYSKDIEIWKQEMLDNLDFRDKKVLAKENGDLKVKIRELKAELRCKEKALAESAALLLLKKKPVLSGRS